MFANVVVAWVVPAILLALVLVASWVGVRWALSEHTAILRSAPLFNGLSTRQLRSILRSAVPVDFRPGETITTEGEPGDSFYLVKEGTAKVLARGAEKGTIGPGGYFGEISVFDGGPRTATIVAQDKVVALELTSQALLHTLDRYPSIARLIFLKLRSLLVAEGESVPYAEDASVDQAVLTDLGQRLRRFREIDWAPADPSRRRGRGRAGGSRPRSSRR